MARNWQFFFHGHMGMFLQRFCRNVFSLNVCMDYSLINTKESLRICNTNGVNTCGNTKIIILNPYKIPIHFICTTFKNYIFCLHTYAVMGHSYVTRKGFVMLAHTMQLVVRRTDKQLSAWVWNMCGMKICQGSHALIATNTQMLFLPSPFHY